MFKFLFKYPALMFSKGTLVLLGPWPVWALFLCILMAMAALAWMLWQRRSRLRLSSKLRIATIWLLQSVTIVILLLLLWQPAISITALRPQQNIIAVVVDDSRSMAVADTNGGAGVTRERQAIQVLTQKLLPEFRKRFQVRLYRLNSSASRVSEPQQLKADGVSTQIGAALGQLADEAATLPIGAVVLLTDGADNTGGVDASTLNELHRRRLPVNTIGFGSEALSRDVELRSFVIPDKVLANSRVKAIVAIKQNSFSGQRATLVIAADGLVVASRDILLHDSPEQTETLELNAGKAGVRRLGAKLIPLPGESNLLNNKLSRVLSVDGTKRRILYVEGEPRWEYKFLRRAVEDDPALEVVSMLRTTQNKIYRQGIASPTELVDGFPTKPEDLFAYQGVILGSIESGFFSTGQQQAIKDFVDKRGGGALFLGGRAALADGDYNAPPLAQLLPVSLPNRKNTFQRKFVAAELTSEGQKSLICRIEDDPTDSVNHWNILPYLADFQNAGTPKAGAVVLAQVNVDGNRLPLLITENYGRGRSAVFATGGSWRWRMQQPVADNSQQTFWRQLLRWSAGPSPSPVVGSVSNAQMEDTGKLQLRADVRNKSYEPASDANVEASIIGPDGASHLVALRPDGQTPGIYQADWEATQAGSYVAEFIGKQGPTELGRDVVTFQRENGVAESFGQQQNRDLLQKLAEDTGGRYYTPEGASRLIDEISFSDAGIAARETMDLWNMPVIFLTLLVLRSTEWLLRRKWGTV